MFSSEPRRCAQRPRVVLAIGVWIGLLAGRIIAALRQERPAQRRLRVCILESGEPARRLAKALLASERPLLDAEAVFLCGSDWAAFDPTTDLGGGRLCAVVAEPWFRGVGQSWGPAALVQLQAMHRSLRQRLHNGGPRRLAVLPRAGTVMACAVECPTLWAGQQPLGTVCGFDLGAFNALRCPEHFETIAGVPLWAHRHRLLTAPTPVLRIDVDGGEEIGEGSVALVELAVAHSGRCDGIALWVNTELDGEVVEPGAPSPARPDQRQGLRLLERPRQLEAGAELTLLVRRWGAGARLEVSAA